MANSNKPFKIKTNLSAHKIDWNLTTWKGAQKEQLKRWSELSLKEILLAQEEMQEIADKLHRNKL